MLIDSSTVRSHVGNHEAPDNPLHGPAEPSGDAGRQPLLLIELGQGGLGIEYPCLELRHHERPGGCVIGKVVNRSSLAEDVVADLLAVDPSGSGSPLPDGPSLLKPRMIGIKESIQLPASPHHLGKDPCVERFE